MLYTISCLGQCCTHFCILLVLVLYDLLLNFIWWDSSLWQPGVCTKCKSCVWRL